MAKHVNLDQAKQIANAVIAKVRDKNYAVKGQIAKTDLTNAFAEEIDAKLDSADLLSYEIRQQGTAESGYAATYQLFSVDGEEAATAVGAKINIPKDFLVKSGSVATVTAADKATGGKFENNSDFAVGDKYIDFVINTKDGSGTDEHMYINVADLVDTYTAGTGIDITNNAVSVRVVASNGLSVGTNGIEMAVVTASSEGTGGSNGAMLATDKEKLDSIEFATAGDITALINSLDSLDPVSE